MVWRKYFKITYNALTSRIYKEHLQFSTNKATQLKINEHFSKEEKATKVYERRLNITND